jgi:hypothetical protein
MAVGAGDQATRRRLEQGLIIALSEQWIREVAVEKLVDQLRHRPTAAAVAQVDGAALEIKPAGEAAGRTLRICGLPGSLYAGLSA